MTSSNSFVQFLLDFPLWKADLWLPLEREKRKKERKKKKERERDRERRTDNGQKE